MVVGICVGETNLNEVTFISNKMPQVGQYGTPWPPCPTAPSSGAPCCTG